MHQTDSSAKKSIRELRIFLSSTFNDLQPEREQLIKKVFPKIRAIARLRNIEFTEIDLRWGVTVEEAQSGKVLRICLEEIDKCRPYFIGIIGSRYGWCPSESDINKDPELVDSYPWLLDMIRQGKSIVEIEFTYGAIMNENKSAFIYEQQYDDNATKEDRTSLDNLKNGLKSKGLLSYSFKTPEELGEQVYKDLLHLIERDFPEPKSLTAAETERLPHESFAANRIHSYVADPQYYKHFEEFVLTGRTPIILSGKSGIGKSALMAYLTTEYKNQNPSAFIIRHFTGVTSGSSNADEILRHIILEIKERYNIDDKVPLDVIQAFPVWLGLIPENEKIIIAIDAINQLSGIDNQMHWLPNFIPTNVRLIVSTTPGIALEQLRSREWDEIVVKPLTSEQRKQITVNFLSRYHKTLTSDQLHLVANDKKAESPLFLRTLIEELRIHGIHETINVHLANYLSSKDERDLFQKVLSRMEKDHGSEVVQNVLGAIWSSRFGLSENELAAICGLPQLILSQLLQSLEFHLMKPEGKFTFFHNYLRDAIEWRYLKPSGQIHVIGIKLADYFRTTNDLQRRVEEEPWLLNTLGLQKELRDSVTDPKVFAKLILDENKYDLVKYWKSLASEFDFQSSYENAIKGLQNDPHPRVELLNLLAKLGQFCLLISKFNLAEYYYSEALTLAKQIYGEFSENTLNATDDYASALLLANKYIAAEEIMLRSLRLRETTESNILDQCNALDNLATLYANMSKYDLAAEPARRSLELITKEYGNEHQQTALRLKNYGAVLAAIGELEEAERTTKSAINILEKTTGSLSADIADLSVNLSYILRRLKKFEEAIKLNQKALDIHRSIFGDVHEQVAISHSNLATSYYLNTELNLAKHHFLQAIIVRSKIVGDEHISTIRAYLSLARIETDLGKYKEAKEIFEKFIPLRKQLLGADHPDVKLAESNYQTLLEKIGNKKTSPSSELENGHPTKMKS